LFSGTSASLAYTAGGTDLTATAASIVTKAGMNLRNDKSILGSPSFTPSMNSNTQLKLDSPQTALGAKGFINEVTP
jgi:hypothetical protein